MRRATTAKAFAGRPSAQKTAQARSSPINPGRFTPIGGNYAVCTVWDLEPGVHTFDVIVTDAEGDMAGNAHVVNIY